MAKRRHNIKKKKSFMFTTKHHSFPGVVGCIVGAISISVYIFSIYVAFENRGKIPTNISGMAVFALVSDFIGLLCGTTALSERDIHRWVPITSIVANSVMIALWVLLVLYGAR